jgi:hypothetical protein
MDAKTLRALRRMTVENGCTPAEAAVAAQKIADWEARTLKRQRLPEPPAGTKATYIKPPRWNFVEPKRGPQKLED